MSQSTTAAVARQISCPGVSGARYSLPSRWEQRPLKRTKTEIRQMIAAIQKTAAERPGAHADLGDPKELIRQLQSVLDGRCKPRDLLPDDVKREDAAKHPVYGWLAALSWPWSDLDKYLPHRGLRGVIITREGGRTRSHKLMGDGKLLDADPKKSGAEIAVWLEQNDFVQTGALLKQEGDGANEGDWAVCYLRPWDSPELLSEALGRPVAPATLAYYPAEDKLATNRRRGNIKRERERAPSVGRDLGVVELPTLAAMRRLYGMEDVARYAEGGGRYTDSRAEG